MEFVAFGDLDGRAKFIGNGVGERFARVASVDQHIFDLFQVFLAAVEGFQGAFPVGHFGRRYGDRVREALGVHRDVALDAGDLLARVIALLGRRVRVFHALRVYDQEAGQALASLFDSGLANRFFFAPVPAR